MDLPKFLPRKCCIDAKHQAQQAAAIDRSNVGASGWDAVQVLDMSVSDALCKILRLRSGM